MHIVKLVHRRFPNSSGAIIGLLSLLSISALALGIGLLLLK